MLRYKVILLVAVVALTTTDQTLLADGTNILQELRRFPIQNLDGLLVTNSVLSLDLANSVDGNGSLLIQGANSVIGLYDVGALKIQNGTLHCFAHTKTAGSVDAVRLCLYLEFAGQKDASWNFINWAPSQQWQRIHLAVTIEKARIPKRIVVGVEILGKGKVWIDDIRICWEQKN